VIFDVTVGKRLMRECNPKITVTLQYTQPFPACSREFISRAWPSPPKEMSTSSSPSRRRASNPNEQSPYTAGISNTSTVSNFGFHTNDTGMERKNRSLKRGKAYFIVQEG